MRKIITLSAALLVSATVFSQQAAYNKFYLSASYGINYDLKNPYPENLGPDFLMNYNGAYFLTPNVGLGLNYHFNNGSKIGIVSFPTYGDGSVEVDYDEPYPFLEVDNNEYKESIHYFGGSLFGRFYLGKSSYRAQQGYGRRMTGKSVSRWALQVNVGIGCMWLKRYDETMYVNYELIDPISGLEVPESWIYRFQDAVIRRTVGFTAAAGIHYRINSFMGIGATADGLFGSIEQWWKCQRIGVLVGLEFYF
ncbi:MAG: hypothetical protein LBT50_00750 [Prevotellaceae bacterium]|jgi:hypothetical protein|nr:hypothetical protein [Prevotellaceae bacterium]